MPCSANVSPPSLAADMLCGAFNVIAFSWIASPAATELEAVRRQGLGGRAHSLCAAARQPYKGLRCIHIL